MIDPRKTLLFSYLFTILNSSQGTIVFIFHCVLSKSVRDELIKGLRKQKRRLFSSLGVDKSGDSKSNSPQLGTLGHFSSHKKRGPNNSSSTLNKTEFRLSKKYTGSNTTNSSNKTTLFHQIKLVDDSGSSSSNERDEHEQTKRFWLFKRVCKMIRSPFSSSSLSTTDSNKKLNNELNNTNNNSNNLNNMTPMSSNESNNDSTDSPFHYFATNPNHLHHHHHHQAAKLLHNDDDCSLIATTTDNRYYISSNCQVCNFYNFLHNFVNICGQNRNEIIDFSDGS
jgi:hypothetical protein